jgi:hypothetical protein
MFSQERGISFGYLPSVFVLSKVRWVIDKAYTDCVIV